MEPGDVVLVCSDGLHGVVSDEEIADVLRKSSGLQAATQSLVDLANAKGGPGQRHRSARAFRRRERPPCWRDTSDGPRGHQIF